MTKAENEALETLKDIWLKDFIRKWGNQKGESKMKQQIWIDNIKGVDCLQCMHSGLHYCVAIMNGLPSALIELAGLMGDGKSEGQY